MSDPTNIDIRIKTTAETGGAKETAKALGEVRDQTRRADDATASSAKGLSRASATYGVLANLLRGNLTGAFVAAQRASQAFGRGMAVLLGPIGLVVGALATLAVAAKRGFDERRENRLQKDAEAAEEKLNVAREAADALRAATAEALSSIRAEAQQATQAYEGLAKAIADARKRRDELNDAQLGADIAGVDAEEAVDLSNASNDEDKALIRARAERRRADLRLAADERRIDDDVLQAGITRSAAQNTQSGARAIINTGRREAEDARAAADNAVAQSDDIERGGGSAAEAQAAQNFARQLIAKAEAAESRFSEIAARQTEIIARAQEAIDAANQTEEIARPRMAEVRARQTAQAARETSEEADLAGQLPASAQARIKRDALARVRNPVDLDADQQEQVARRAIEINKNALAQEGQQAGETIGEALGLALKEAFPEVSNAILANLRGYVDQAVQAESGRLQSQIKTLRTR